MYYPLKTDTSVSIYKWICREVNDTTDCQQLKYSKNGPILTYPSEAAKTPHFIKIVTKIVQTKQSERSYSQYSSV